MPEPKYDFKTKPAIIPEEGDQCQDCIQYDWCNAGRKEAVARGEKADPKARCMFCSQEW
ncbi:MAG: hypothetical protein NTV39_04550 [Candidatus Saccharibacteria bacterium]|nr:hypothetical protein [Candidatus Saccharibacteria bacterium]